MKKESEMAGNETTAEALVAANLARVRETISAACRRAGRSAVEVRLVAVTKYATERAVRALLAAGAADLGESHVQQLVKRAAYWGASDVRFDAEARDIRGGRSEEGGSGGAIWGGPRPARGPDATGAPPRWHMIGHVQRNKVNALLTVPATVHSVDSERLAEKLAERASAIGRDVDAFVEINVAGESAKTGAALGTAPRLVEFAAGRRGLRLRGLMTMAPYDDNPERARPHFAALRELLARLRRSGAAPPTCDQLSMGMSGDFQVAIEEGATVVRVGTALFEGLKAGAVS